MSRQHRTFVVMLVAVAAAAAASYGVYQAILRMPVRQVEVASTQVVVASQGIPVGTRLTTDHLKVVAWPARSPVPGAFADPKQLVDRGVIASIGENEPVTNLKIASPESGSGLPPVIPEGMRAMSVKVNDVIGVAGFVVPGTRVDVLVTMRSIEGSQDAMSRVVVSNVLVLTAGTRYDQTQSKDGKPIPTSVVTLAVLPVDAERIALASSEGKLSLALRNPLDVAPTQTPGVRVTALMRGATHEPVVVPGPRRPAAAQPRVVIVPPPAPSTYTVETFRAAKRGEEVVR